MTLAVKFWIVMGGIEIAMIVAGHFIGVLPDTSIDLDGAQEGLHRSGVHLPKTENCLPRYWFTP
jgi:hypothetical protein